MKTYNSARVLLTVAGLLALGIFAPLAFGQAAQIKKIHMDARAKADSVMADSSLSDADKQAKVKEIHRSAMMEANKVLTPDQRAQLEKKMKEHQESKPPSNP